MKRESLPERLAAWLIRHRRTIVVGWALLVVVLAPFAGQTVDRLAVGVSGIDKSAAARVEDLLATRFRSPFASYALLVVLNVPPPSETEGRVLLREVVSELEAVSGVTRTLSYLDVRDARLVAPSGTYLVVGLSPGSRRLDEMMVELRSVASKLQTKLRGKYPRTDLMWTGGAAFDYDVRLTGAADAATAEQRVLPLSLVVLLIVFGSLVAALLPIAMGAAAITVSLGAAVLLTSCVSLTVLLQNIVSMLGLGLGIDYSLLMVSRFREAMSRSDDAEAAALEAARRAGHTILVSAGAVAIGFAALSVIPVSELRSIAIGGVLVVAVSALLATTLLPGLLAWLGPRVDLGRLRRRQTYGSSVAAWRTWGNWVAKHPLVVLIIAGTPLLALAWQVNRMSTGIPSGTWLPAGMQSVRGAEALKEMGQSGLIQTVRVVVELPGGTALTTDTNWQGVLRLSRVLARDPRIAHAQSLPLAIGQPITPERLAAVPADLRNSLMSGDHRLALIELVPREGENLASVMRYVRELRASDVANRELPGALLHVGGLSAYNVDYEDAVGGSVLRVMALVVGGSLVALFIGFRSLLVAVKAVGLNLLAVAAAMGALVLVFQDGHGSSWLGLSAPIDGLFPAVPIIVFCIVFGLSMDYEVFIVSRVVEYVRAGATDAEALAEGLAHSAGVVTAAALVMIIVFGAFSMGEFLVVKILGFCLAVAVAIDGLLVRIALAPALLRLAGRWNWWPGGRA